MRTSDAEFAGTIPQTYERYLVPALFEPYATKLAASIAKIGATRVLEIAAGTGVVTRALRAALPAAVEIVATDLNPAMLEIAKSRATLENVRYEVADAATLPFEAAAFDAVVCQFGVMFFPDKSACTREVRRVLKRGGTYAFSVWGDLPSNPLGAIVVNTCKTMFPDDPPLFLSRGPYGYNDVATIEAMLVAGGFPEVCTETIDERCRAGSARDLAIGMSEGSPLYHEVLARQPAGIGLFRDAIARALGQEHGFEPIDAPMRAHVFFAR